MRAPKTKNQLVAMTAVLLYYSMAIISIVYMQQLQCCFMADASGTSSAV